MTTSQKTFASEYLRTGNKIAAYCKAYPKARRSSVKSAANRLLRQHPEIEEQVNGRRSELAREAEQEVKEELKAAFLSRDRIRHLLTLTAEGLRTTERVYQTRDGFAERQIKPTHGQMLNAINAYIRLEGLAASPPVARKEKRPPEKRPPGQQPPEKKDVQIFIGGLPVEEFTALYSDTIDAYYDKEDGTARHCPGNPHTMERFIAIQQKREARKDAEREAAMTSELRHEEELAIKEFQGRPLDDSLYRPHEALIEELQDAYIEGKREEQLRELKAVQKMCGLRFLHPRHRYAAEREAGWQFHPLNNDLVRKTPSGASRGQEEETTQKVSPPGGLFKNTSIRQQTATIKVPSGFPRGQKKEATQKAPLPEAGGGGAAIDRTGYAYIKNIVEDHWDKYINNQHSGTYKAYNDVVKLARSAHDPALRAQVEQETGWEYHPLDCTYARKKRPADLSPSGKGGMSYPSPLGAG